MFAILKDFLPLEQHYLIEQDTNHEHQQTISLNMVKRYRDHLPPSSRENLQNWRDQCYKLAHVADPSNPFPNPEFQTQHFENYQNSRISFHLYSAWASEELLGWVLQTCSQINKTQEIFLYNNHTLLEPSILRFGHSDKTNSPFLAGTYGDGLKAELNRLLATGSGFSYDEYFKMITNFRIRTGPNAWTFHHDDQDSLLCDIGATSEKVSSYGTLIHISDISTSSVAIDPTKYLFLQSNQDLGTIVSHVSKGKKIMTTILMEPRFHDKIFFHGIYICNLSDKYSVGVDINTLITSDTGLGIERNNVSQSFVVQQLLSVCAAVQQQEEQEISTNVLNDLRLRIFTGLQAQSLMYSYSGNNQQSLGEFLFEGFILKEHQKFMKERSPSTAVPKMNRIPLTEKESVSYGEELRMFGWIPKSFKNTTLLGLLRLAPKCPCYTTIQSSYTTRYVLLPEYVTSEQLNLPYKLDDEAEPQTFFFQEKKDDDLFIQLRDIMLELVNDNNALSPFSIRYKLFPTNTTPRSITPLKYKGNVYYIVDIRQFTQKKFHEFFKEEDSDYQCNGETCSCIHMHFFDELLEAIEHVFPDSKRKTKATRALQRKMMSQLSAVKSVTNIPEPQKPQSKEQQQPEPSSNNKPASTKSSIAKPTSTKPSRKPAEEVTDELKDLKVEQQTTPCPPPRPTPPDINAPYFENVVDAANKCVKKTGESSTASAEAELIFHAAKQSQLVLQEKYGYTQAETEINLVKNHEMSELVMAIGVTVYSNPGLESQLNKFVSEIMDLAYIVAQLWNSFYADNDVKCNVYYDESPIIAFNRGGRIYFNVFYHIKLRSLALDYVLSHWFTVIVHELAHNLVPNHGQEFSKVFEHLVTTYIPPFVERNGNIKAAVELVRRSLYNS
ncbi:hypothetical protein RCL1_005033 [Eukaryota sp. TZLM3-RCL]